MGESLRTMDLGRAQSETFDITIIGGGINGACLYHRLSRLGYRVLLADKGDFAGGTSQASAMMVWGGLLYLKNLDILTVAQFSRDRESLIRQMGNEVSPSSFRYVPSKEAGWNKILMATGLYFYWLLGQFQRERPRMENTFPEQAFLKPGEHEGSFLYQEAVLHPSDSRFVLNWITAQESEHAIALNYCGVTGGEYYAREKLWRLTLRDEITGWSQVARSRCVINCAGIWTDEVNRLFGIDSPYKHVFSKGVFLGLPREKQHQVPLIFDMGQQGDVLCHIPWGPVALWGPTETTLVSLGEGVHPEPEDIEFLLAAANNHLKRQHDSSDVISLRCGVRPLVVDADYSASQYPLDLSRKNRIVRDPFKPWISVYGGKFTSCVSLARKVELELRKYVTGKRDGIPSGLLPPAAVEWDRFPGLDEQVPSLRWCIDKEKCLTLEDYLRRRTNISQWISREGLGKDNENVPHLERLALQFSGGDPVHARKLVLDYMESVEARFDSVLMQYA